MAKGQDRPALDDLDRRLMEVLQVDGRRPFTEIATAFAVPESTIRARYKALVDRGITPVDMDVVRPSLEDVYLRLVDGEAAS